MRRLKADEIRKMFLEFFRSKGHTIVPGDSLVPSDDPTLLFTGAGMNQFKDQFMGRNITYRRAASCQKCLRTGDLENVGRTSGHHTFFEMLGNFSFGDYFKREAILWAWEFFTKVLEIPADRLWASVYKDDGEAYGIWKDEIMLPKERIMKLGEKENFWPSEAPSKGPNGPCGPCSEIFYDYGKDVGCKKPDCTPECDCGRFVEVWNMVFTQFDRQSDSSLKPLPGKNIDTGMGLERLASVLQGVKTNFEIDIFMPLIKTIEAYSVERIAYSEKNKDNRKADAARSKMNAIADHIRAVTFAIADDVMPSNEERGYVVRKLIRRAASHGRDIGITTPFLYKLVSVVSQMMGTTYPGLEEKRDDIAQVVKTEEENFRSVLQVQLLKVDEAFESIKKSKKSEKLAELAFNFYDTYGIPYEMLEDIAEHFELKINKKEFDVLLEKQREKSRSKTKIKGEIFSETFAKRVEALGLKTEFLGYEKSRAEAKVVAVLKGGEVILDKTPLYGESGGQAGDWGKIETPSGAMEVEDAKRIGDTIVHIGKVLSGSIKKGETAKVSINEEVRGKVAANHTATHLLHSALRKVLGPHVHQKGSLVDSLHLRFDFTHMKKLESRELGRVEEIVNEYIKKAMPVKKEIKDIESARKEGAMALFGEKYGDKVRVVTIADISKELCGGIHASNTKDIGQFKITGESSIASGVRRIEALTGQAAREWAEKRKTEELKRQEMEKRKDDEKQMFKERLKAEMGNVDSILSMAVNVGETKVITHIIEGIRIDGLRAMSDKIRERQKSALVILAAKVDDKASFVVAVTDDLVKKGISAGDIAKQVAKEVEGSGGGKPNFAQGGGRNPLALAEALKKASESFKGRAR